MRIAPKPLALALAVALALGLSACGGGGGASSASSAGAPPSGAEAPKGGEASIEEFGSEAAGSEREAILAAFGSYLDALAAKDYSGACSHLATTVRESLQQLSGRAPKATGCAGILPQLLAPTAAGVARQQADGKIAKVRVGGERAFVVFKAPGAKLYEQTMVREGGRWKAATVGAAVLVPDLSSVSG